MGRLDVGGYRIDTGPTVLTMPEIIDDTLGAVGESLADRLDLIEVDPAYHASFADGSQIHVHRDAEAMADEVARVAGSDEAKGYLRLRDWLTELYRVEFDGFIAANFDSPLSLLTPQLARLAAIGGFRRWDRVMSRFITDERLRRIFTFQALYAGVPPQRALAVYAVIAYMDTIAGVYFPRGGMRAVPDALAAAAVTAGVEFRYGATVSGLRQANGRVTDVCTDDGERIGCDAVVLTTELADTYRFLDRRPRRLLPLRPAPSAVVAHLGCRATPETAHHTILFGEAWDQTFRDIIDEGRVMSDPSLLVTRPTAGDPSLAPPGRDLLYVLAPAPNLARGKVDWDQTGPEYLAEHARGRDAPDARGGWGSGGPARRGPRGLGAPGHVRRHPVRARAHLLADGPVPACQQGARGGQRGSGRIVDRSGGRRSDRTPVRPAGGRPRHRRLRPSHHGRTS